MLKFRNPRNKNIMYVEVLMNKNAPTKQVSSLFHTKSLIGTVGTSRGKQEGLVPLDRKKHLNDGYFDNITDISVDAIN